MNKCEKNSNVRCGTHSLLNLRFLCICFSLHNVCTKIIYRVRSDVSIRILQFYLINTCRNGFFSNVMHNMLDLSIDVMFYRRVEKIGFFVCAVS